MCKRAILLYAANAYAEEGLTMPRAMILPPHSFPCDKYEIGGRMVDGETHYTITRKNPRATLTLLFDPFAPDPEDFDKYFSECLGKESEP